MKNWFKKTFSAYACPILHKLSRAINWLQSHVMHILVIILVGMIGCLLVLGFGIDNDMTSILILGTKNKKEALEFIAFGMGGVIAAIVAAAVNRRAAAQEKSNDNEQFKSAMENLGHKDASVRIAAFYLFCYLAKDKDKDKDFRHNIFDILCSCFRSMPRERSHLTEENGKERPTAECQTLLNILFRNRYEFSPDGFAPDLRRVYLIRANLAHASLSNANFTRANLATSDLTHANLTGADFTHANLSNADIKTANLKNAHFSGAQLANANFVYADLTGAFFNDARLGRVCFGGATLRGANFGNAYLNNADLGQADLTHANLQDVNSIEKANFCGAKIGDRPITKDDLPADKGEYYADWNPPPKK